MGLIHYGSSQRLRYDPLEYPAKRSMPAYYSAVIDFRLRFRSSDFLGYVTTKSVSLLLGRGDNRILDVRDVGITSAISNDH